MRYKERNKFQKKNLLFFWWNDYDFCEHGIKQLSSFLSVSLIIFTKLRRKKEINLQIPYVTLEKTLFFSYSSEKISLDFLQNLTPQIDRSRGSYSYIDWNIITSFLFFLNHVGGLDIMRHLYFSAVIRH
jgi:hypothetical protein